MKRRLNRGASLQVMQVVDTYTLSSGQFECDLIDRQGRLYAGCSVMSLGGGDIDISAAPQKDAEVVCVSSSFSTPYILGVLAKTKTFVESVGLTAAGEYPQNEIELFDVQLKNKTCRLVVSDQSLYAMPKLRVQGLLEVSDGNAPNQSLAVAEPLIELLGTYQNAIGELQTAVREIETALMANTPPIPVSLLPLSQISSPSGTIASDLAKTEK